MGRGSIRLIIGFLGLFLFAQQVSAQKAVLDEAELKAYDQRARDLVSFFQYLLNTVGDEASSARDKEVIITESYQKVFRDGEVQIEDDLTSDRLVTINKDVTAYLKDVDFFFNHVTFDYEILKIEPFQRDNGQWSFKIEANRSLKGIGLEGQDVLNSQKRFIEINLDREKDDLKIASIYTTRINRDKALREWWNSLSFEWMSVLTDAAGIVVAEEPTTEQLATMAAVDSLNLRDNRLLIDLQPVEMLLDLWYLNVGNTRISDLSPIRGLSKLAHLDIGSTNVDNIEYLRYAGNILVLDISGTPVTNLDVLAHLESLEELSLKGIPATDFEEIAALQGLKKLNLSFTGFGDPRLLSNLASLEILDISYTSTYGIEALSSLYNLRVLVANQTFIPDLAPLGDLKALRVLEINETPVSSLEPLEQLSSLQRVYCDNTSVTDRQADEFAAKMTNTLVIINSRQLEDWWNGLAGEWKLAFQAELQVARGQQPTKEQLVSLTKSDSLVLVNKGLRSLTALERFKNMRFLDISKNPVSELISLAGLQNLRIIKANDTPVEDISALSALKDLEHLELINTKIYDLQPLAVLPKLRYLNIEDTFVAQGAVVSLLASNPGCTIIYQTRVLQEWWGSLPDVWQLVFSSNAGMKNTPTAEELHRLVTLPSINTSGSQILTLEPLYKFVHLQELNISATGLSYLGEIRKLSQLKKLDCSKNPLSDLTPLRELVFLEELNVSNTAADDLRQIDNLTSLEALYCAGTQLKNMKGIERFANLKEIDISNTKVRRLDRLIEIRTLQSLVCFNTRISSRKISDFQRERPECEVTYY